MLVLALHVDISCSTDVDKLVTESRKILKAIAGIETDKVHFIEGHSLSLSVTSTPAGGENDGVTEISSQ